MIEAPVHWTDPIAAWSTPDAELGPPVRMAKSASGALDLVPLIEVRNLGDTLELLKKRGMRVLGFDSEAPSPLVTRSGDEMLAIVLGAEGKGLRQRTRELCDEMVRLEMPGPIKSLNVSNAAAIALFAATSGRAK